MSKDYTIYTKADPGPAIIKLVAELIEPLEYVDTVRFEAWVVEDGKPGSYDPIKKEVIIDLGNILNNYDLHRMGMLYIAGIWYTVIWTILHETIHAKQIEADPEILELVKAVESPEEMAELASDYENAAQAATKDAMQEFVTNHKLPPLSEWAWLGEKITGLVNDLYVKGDTKLLDEIEVLSEGAVADVEHVLATYEFHNPPELYKSIIRGEFGLKHKDRYYLTAIDFFALDEPIKSIARTAPTVFMG